jgi:hypothetical protein
MVGLHLVNREDLGLVQSLPYWAKWLWIPSLSLVLLVAILRCLIGTFMSLMTTNDASSIDIPPSPTLSNRSSLTSVIEELDPDIDPFPFSYRPLSLVQMLDLKDFDMLANMGGTAGLLRGLGSNVKHGLSKQGAMTRNQTPPLGEVGTEIDVDASPRPETPLEKEGGDRSDDARMYNASLDERRQVYGRS